MQDRGVSVSMIYPIMKAIAGKGYAADDFLKHAEFDTSLLQRDADARMDGAELERLMLAAAAYTGDDYFGLRQGDYVDFADLGILGYVLMHSPTIKDGLAAYRRYNAILCSSFNIDLEESGDSIVIRLLLQHEGRWSRHCVEDMASSLYRLLGKLSSRHIGLHRVQFMHSGPADVGPYRDVFGQTPVFEAEDCVIELDSEVMDYPILYSDGRLLQLFESLARQSMERLDEPSTVSELVMRTIRSHMPSRFPTLQQTAESLGMSPRTLQHKLKLEQASYSGLSNKVREELAIDYLRKREIAVSEIAYALHFSETSAFQIAFKKWTGLTPSQYRMQIS